MKKNFITLILFILFVTFVSCQNDMHESYDVNNNDTRFQIIYVQSTTHCTHIEILLDKETGIKYLFVDKGIDCGGGLTKLEE